MKPSEMLIAVEDFMSTKGITLEMFYSITINGGVELQGYFNPKIINAFKNDYLWDFTLNGYVRTYIEIHPNGFERIISTEIILTEKL